MTCARPKIHGVAADGRAVARVALLVAGLAACASLPVPTALMDRAQSEIRAARGAGAATSAPDALAEAARRLAAAQQLVVNGDNDKATEKAQEAAAAAATARVRAQLAQLDQQIRQQTAVNEGLAADLKRRQAEAAAAQRGDVTPPASGASGGLAPVSLPSIQLGQPAPPASAGGVPAAAGSSGVPAPWDTP